jgi:hypothetical protein
MFSFFPNLFDAIVPLLIVCTYKTFYVLAIWTQAKTLCKQNIIIYKATLKQAWAYGIKIVDMALTSKT